MLPSTVRGRVYRKAFWLLVKKLCLIDFIEALDVLRECCEKEELYTSDTQDIINETVNKYLERKEDM